MRCVPVIGRREPDAAGSGGGRAGTKIAERRRATKSFKYNHEVNSAWEGAKVPDRRVDPNSKFKSKHKHKQVGFSTECELVEFPEKDLGPHLDDASWQLPSAMSIKQSDAAV